MRHPLVSVKSQTTTDYYHGFVEYVVGDRAFLVESNFLEAGFSVSDFSSLMWYHCPIEGILYHHCDILLALVV